VPKTRSIGSTVSIDHRLVTDRHRATSQLIPRYACTCCICVAR